MSAGQRLPYSCVESCLGLYERALVYDIRASIVSEGPQRTVTGNQDRVWLVVKSIELPSIDEIPIINSILESLGDTRTEVYTYEELDSTDRALRLSQVLREGISSGLPMIVVMPGLMGVTLTSKMDKDVIEALESSTVVEAWLEYSNVLYLPEEPEVELVGKENSESSYERIEWLQSEASKRGVRVAGVRLLRDNRAIWDYVTSLGLEGLRKRVPVNKVAWLVAVLSDCIGAHGFQVIQRRERARHYIYLIGLGRELAALLINRLAKRSNTTCSPPDHVKPAIENGCREALGMLYAKTFARIE